MSDLLKSFGRTRPIKLIINWISGGASRNPATIQATITGETIKTIQIYYKKRTVWLQKSLVKLIKEEGDSVTIVIPVWLFDRKFSRPRGWRAKR